MSHSPETFDRLVLGLHQVSRGLTAALPMKNPYCSCRLTQLVCIGLHQHVGPQFDGYCQDLAHPATASAGAAAGPDPKALRFDRV